MCAFLILQLFPCNSEREQERAILLRSADKSFGYLFAGGELQYLDEWPGGPTERRARFFAPALAAAAGHPIDRTCSAQEQKAVLNYGEVSARGSLLHDHKSKTRQYERARAGAHKQRESPTRTQRGFTLGCARVLCKCWDTLAASIHQGHPSSQVAICLLAAAAGAIPDVSERFFPCRLRIRRPHRKSHTSNKNSQRISFT
jgi:hypothetical protein